MTTHSKEYAKATAFLESLPLPKDWTLERMRKLVEKAGIDYRGLKFVHVTGSNGKGSVCADVYSILRQAGFKAGAYTSPHLADWRERFLLNGKLISRKDFVRLAWRIKPHALKLGASQFEVLTAIALAWFSERKPDWVVWEAGLGGRLDATNVSDARYAIITSISLEHTEKLGNTVERIAQEKSKIIKRNATAITGSQGLALKEIQKECEAQKARLLRIGAPSRVSCNAKATKFSFRGREWSSSLLGFHQADNAALAIVFSQDLGISDKIIEKGLKNARWPGRMQVFSRRPLAVLDGAHNPAGVKSLCLSFKNIFGAKPIIVMGVMADKDWRKMTATIARELKPSLVIATAPAGERSLGEKVLAKRFASLGITSFAVKGVKNAFAIGLEKGLEEKKTVLAAGSLYVIGEILS